MVFAKIALSVRQIRLQDQFGIDQAEYKANINQLYDAGQSPEKGQKYLSTMKTIVYIMLATLVLVSTSGVAVTKHLCNAQVASVAAVSDRTCCCGEMHAGDGCCYADREFFQVDDDFVVTTGKKLNFFTSTVFSVLVYHLSLDFGDIDQSVAFRLYKEPLPHKDIPVLFQSFLI